MKVLTVAGQGALLFMYVSLCGTDGAAINVPHHKTGRLSQWRHVERPQHFLCRARTRTNTEIHPPVVCVCVFERERETLGELESNELRGNYKQQ